MTPSPAVRVVVVGGGILGSMHAWLALEAGAEVTLIEREDAARGASVRNFGLVWVSGRSGGNELALALRARELWELVAEAVPGVAFRPNGSLTVVESAAELAVLEEVMRLPDAGERGFELLDADATREVNPALRGRFLGSLHCPLDAAVEPRLACNALRTAMEGDARFHYLAGRHAVEAGDGFVRDHTGKRHEADLVVLCVGANYRGLAGWSGDGKGLRRVRLQMLETEPFPEKVATSVADGNSLRYYPVFDVPALAGLPVPVGVVDRFKVQLLLQQRLDGGLTIGDTHVYDEPFDVATENEPYAYLLARAEAIFGRSLPPVRRRWAGVYSQAVDPNVMFHREPLGERTVVVTGPGGRGMTMSPAIAESVLASYRLGV